MISRHDMHPEQLSEAVCTVLMQASVSLEPGLVNAVNAALDAESAAFAASSGEDHRSIGSSLQALRMIRENLSIASSTGLPMCQDTGMVLGLVSLGPDSPLGMHELKAAIEAGIAKAVVKGHFRHSVVDDPIFDRTNTCTNLPAVLHWLPKEGNGIDIHLMLKGFGSENCGSVAMLAPTSGPEGVADAVVSIVAKAGGKPCPPIVVGVGVGGTMDQAALLSKQALFRPVGQPSKHAGLASLEQQIMGRIQSLRIGAAGFGGTVTALGVAVETAPTHIAGLPVAVSISCWADRKAEIVYGGADADRD